MFRKIFSVICCVPLLFSISPVFAQEPQSVPDMKKIYLMFFIKFIAILAVIYMLVLLTGKIGSIYEHKKATQTDHLPETIKMDIPMQAKLPDFDTISENDTSHNPDEFFDSHDVN